MSSMYENESLSGYHRHHVHAFDFNTGKASTYTFPDKKETPEVPKTETRILTIAVDKKDDSYVAALRGGPDGLVLAIEKPTAGEAVGALTEMYLRLPEPDQKPKSSSNVPWSETFWSRDILREKLKEAIHADQQGKQAEKFKVHLGVVYHKDGTRADSRDFSPWDIRETDSGDEILVGYDHLRNRVGSFYLDKIKQIRVPA